MHDEDFSLWVFDIACNNVVKAIAYFHDDQLRTNYPELEGKINETLDQLFKTEKLMDELYKDIKEKTE